MNGTVIPRLFTFVITVSALLLTSACVSAQRQASVAAEPKVLLNETEYEKVYVTGSNLPILVPKKGTAQPLPSMSPVATMSPAGFREAMNPARARVRR